MTIIITARTPMFIYNTHTNSHFIDWYYKLFKHCSLENDTLEPIINKFKVCGCYHAHPSCLYMPLSLISYTILEIAKNIFSIYHHVEVQLFIYKV